MDSSDNLRVYLFTSRNKDNQHVKGFKSRSKSFVAYDSNIRSIKRSFEQFVNEGASGETCRLYSSVNCRDVEKVRRGIIHKLVDGADVANLPALAASVASQKSCASESKWLFDFDDKHESKLESFSRDVFNQLGGDTVETYSTINGYGVIAKHGFDTRKLMKTWGNIVTLMRDGMQLQYWKVNQ